ncbi:uncharacterized protein EDB91DRAFT_1315197 [Suillus paluster]|uniref:uncharacterized protein n=1 Tax=Suillus paluster TaxID=48578 RepID=UPI001B86BE6C|nr:uncharacterized protein EDB91DRAFT_1315197 [Suillus paluster]KAG1748462.1 hypothetical protein EDB91DRAFT_1315197 [Suillus paluster]
MMQSISANQPWMRAEGQDVADAAFPWLQAIKAAEYYCIQSIVSLTMIQIIISQLPAFTGTSPPPFSHHNYSQSTRKLALVLSKMSLTSICVPRIHPLDKALPLLKRPESYLPNKRIRKPDRVRSAASDDPLPEGLGPLEQEVSGSLVYLKDNYHWASSSSQLSACSFEPGTTEDLGKVLQILGETKTPFAIKSGGHATNPNVSSTPGVQIAMYSFSDITFDSDTQTATIGTGNVWDDVYSMLEEYGVNAVGGKVTGVGVGGIILGGGYSYLTNQYGLAIDNVISYELVLPNGTVTTVTSSRDPDLFFGLRGGFNNFVRGSLQQYRVKYWTDTFPPRRELLSMSLSKRILNKFGADRLSAANAAIAKFPANVTDTKAAIYSTYDYVLGSFSQSNAFYDAPTYPDGIFDDFLAIPHIEEDISTRSYVSFIRALPMNDTAVFNSIAIEEWTESLLNDIAEETLVSIRISTGENLARLQDIEKAVDPDNVMELAGGWKL